MGAVIMLGPLHFQPMRTLIVVSLLRILSRSEHRGLAWTRLDTAILIYAVCVAFSSVFHADIKSSLITRLGHITDFVGAYATFRCWFRNAFDVFAFYRQCLLLLVPLAFFIALEQITGHNLFSFVSGGALETKMRDGRFRASGPFRHAILAGTFCAVLLPIIVYYWRNHRSFALLSISAMLIAVVACASSGPILTLAAAGFALSLWSYRDKLRMIIRGFLVFILCLHMIMKDPVWYLMARIDLAGGSTGWHRAKLIDSALHYFSEWWFAGSDYTRHWMPTGVSWSPDHCDITNHYIFVGVTGGLAAMLAFVLIIRRVFQCIGHSLAVFDTVNSDHAFFVWCLGSSLFAHIISMLGVGYFDQVLLAEFILLIVATQTMELSSFDAYNIVEPVPPTEFAAVSPALHV